MSTSSLRRRRANPIPTHSPIPAPVSFPHPSSHAPSPPILPQRSPKGQICSLHAPCMLQRCSNYAPRMLPRCSATQSRFLVKQQIPFSTLIKTPKPHPSSKYSPIHPLSHPPFSRRKCDEYPHPPIFTLIPKTQLLNPPPRPSSPPLTPCPPTTYPQQIFSTLQPTPNPMPTSPQRRQACLNF